MRSDGEKERGRCSLGQGESLKCHAEDSDFLLCKLGGAVMIQVDGRRCIKCTILHNSKR